MHHQLTLLPQNETRFVNDWSMRPTDPAVERALEKVKLKAVEIEIEGSDTFALGNCEAVANAPQHTSFHATLQLPHPPGISGIDIDEQDGVIRLKLRPVEVGAAQLGSYCPLSPDELEDTDDED